METSDLALQLYAALRGESVEETSAYFLVSSKSTHQAAFRLAAAAETIIAERVREARECEREKVADFMLARSFVTGHGDTTEDLLAELGAQITEREAAARREALREAYNAVCGQFMDRAGYDEGVTACRDAIAALLPTENEDEQPTSL